MTKIENVKSYINGLITAFGIVYAITIISEIKPSSSLMEIGLATGLASLYVFGGFYFVNYIKNYESKELKL